MGETIGEFAQPGTTKTINGRGQCKTEDDVLALGVDVDTGEPIVCSGRTGKRFILPWADICSLAVHAGVSINEQEKH